MTRRLLMPALAGAALLAASSGAWAQEAGGFPIFTLPMGFLMKDVLFLAASFYLLKQDLARAAMDIERS